MFDSPPAVIRPTLEALDHLSNWFDWEALGAIGTVGALWFAVVQSSRAARVEQTKQIGTLTALIGLIEPACEAVPTFPNESVPLAGDDVDHLLDAERIITRALDGLERLPFVEIASVGATEYVSALSLCLADIQERLPIDTDDVIFPASLNSSSGYLGEACEFFRSKRDYIKYGWLGSKLRRVVRRIEGRIWQWHHRHWKPISSQASPPAEEKDAAQGTTASVQSD